MIGDGHVVSVLIGRYTHNISISQSDRSQIFPEIMKQLSKISRVPYLECYSTVFLYHFHLIGWHIFLQHPSDTISDTHQICRFVDRHFCMKSTELAI